MDNNWDNTSSRKLFEAFALIENADEAARFCRDLMTEPEIEAFAGRFEAALLLSEGVPQREVTEKTGVSIATVTRVNQWLKRGMNGYKDVIEKYKHSKPALAG